MEDKVFNPLTDDLDWPECDSAKLTEDVDDEEYDPMSFDYKPVKVSEAEKAAAEKAYKAELTNGPEKMVWYGSRQFPKKVGSFDLENMHKAYDDWFTENKLLDIFSADGKFKNKGTYVRYKELDKTIPAVKALRTMYTAQFSGDLPFTDDKRAAETKRKAEEERQNAIKAQLEIQEKLVNEAVEELKSKIESSAEFKALVEEYPEDMAEKIKVVTTTATQVHTWDHDKIGSSVEIQVVGVLQRKKSNGHESNKLFRGTVTDTSSKAAIESEILPAAIESLKNMTKSVAPYLFAIKNYDWFKNRRGEADLDCEDTTWIGYYNAKLNKVARTKFMEFQVTVLDESGNPQSELRRGLVLLNAESNIYAPEVIPSAITSSWVLVGCRANYRSGGNSSGTWNWSKADDFFKSQVNPAILKRLRLETVVSGGGNGDTAVKIAVSIPDPYSKYFDRGMNWNYECDSGD